ncbi:MAG: cytochrome P450 [Myxococcales bacterium]|nr:cytochrome P450 [Myxococcales bacterium]
MSEANLVDVGANPADRARNRATGAGVVDDPYPTYDRMRETGPVHEGAISTAFEVEGMPDSMIWSGRKQFACYDWESVDAVLRDAETFSSTWYAQTLGSIIGQSMIQMDGAQHRRYRALIQPAFTRKEMEDWRKRWVQTTVDRILDEVIARGEPADLYAELCAKVPVFTIASSFGVAPEDVSRFHELAVTAAGTVGTHQDRVAAAEEIADYLRDVIALRRKDPSDDLIGLLCNVEIEDPEDGSRHQLNDADILAFARLMLPAGAGTTYRGLGCLLLGLLQTDQMDMLREDRSLLDAAIEESLRWEQPLTAVGRLVTRDTEVGGLAVPEGSVIHACMAAANHDPSRWPDPHRFDIRREQRTHSTFGSGPHLCIGMHLARMEMRTAMNAILDRLPALRLDADAPTPWVTGLLFRMPTAVPVVFDA